MKTKRENQQRCLLATMTNEPFQPVRLYYTIPDKTSVVKKLKKLECTVEAPYERCWQWLYHAEAAALQFTAGGYDDVPEDRRPIILGRIRFPTQSSMTLETNSFDRAVAGARFFARRLGVDVVATRCRVVNRCFAADEGQSTKLMAMLDRDVTVIDPSEAEAALRSEFKGVRSPKNAGRAMVEFLDRKIKSKEDVPLVEDFPLAPEEEMSEFQYLATTLYLRFIRAVEHWQGNTHLTLTSIIIRAVEQGMFAGPGSRQPSRTKS
jgi:hypothetical protein